MISNKKKYLHCYVPDVEGSSIQEPLRLGGSPTGPPHGNFTFGTCVLPPDMLY